MFLVIIIYSTKLKEITTRTRNVLGYQLFLNFGFPADIKMAIRMKYTFMCLCVFVFISLFEILIIPFGTTQISDVLNLINISRLLKSTGFFMICGSAVLSVR